MARVVLPIHRLEQDDYLANLDLKLLRPLEQILPKPYFLKFSFLANEYPGHGSLIEQVTIDICSPERRRNWLHLLYCIIFRPGNRVIASIRWSFACTRTIIHTQFLIHTSELDRAGLIDPIESLLEEVRVDLRIPEVKPTRYFAHSITHQPAH